MISRVSVHPASGSASSVFRSLRGWASLLVDGHRDAGAYSTAADLKYTYTRGYLIVGVGVPGLVSAWLL